VGVLEKLGWKPPSSKQSGITDADTLFSDKTITHIEKYYNEEVRYINVAADGSDIGKDVDHRYTTLGANKKAIPITLSQHLYQDDKSRYQDPKYNDKNAPLQIHCFGDSWTYGWDVKQEECFVHLLGDENTSVWNYGGGKTGLDWAVKKVTEVYHNFNHRENQNFVYVITVPHSFRRMHFEDNGTARRTWDKPVAAETNEYNHFLYFYHHYEILNRLIGRDKIIWGTWDDEIPKKMIDVFFDLHDYAGRHPGPESHKLYAEQIKTIMRDNGWYNESN
jgi:hypothetical protein|tara:strand:+ start:64 stop:894 length:831 start_codon:yes stop_codon:yes gene_type:complete